MSIKELQKEILNGNIEFSRIIHYDEEYLWIRHQPYVRLTILDAENKLIIEDTVIQDIYFQKNYIKIFLETSLIDLTVETIITDRYPHGQSNAKTLANKSQNKITKQQNR